MQFRSLLIVAPLALSGSPALAGSLDVGLNNDSARVTYATPLGKEQIGRSEGSFGVLFNTDDAFFTFASLDVINSPGDTAPGLGLGVGVKLFAARTDPGDASGLAINLGARFSPQEAKRLTFAVDVSHAPKIVTFGDADRYTELGARVEYEIMPAAAVYVGYNKLRLTIPNGGSATIDDGWSLGVRMHF